MTAAAPTPLRLGAVVLTGGTARRMGGADKAALEIAGVTLLERALAATVAALEVVVVGTPVPTSQPVTWTREKPPGGGPAAGLLAGIDRLSASDRSLDLVVVLAVDMPRIDAGTVARLTWAVENAPPDGPGGTGGTGVDGAVLVDAAGRRQTLAGVYRLSSLHATRPEDPQAEHGLPVRSLVDGLRLVEVPVVGDEARDVDTWADLRDLVASTHRPDPPARTS